MNPLFNPQPQQQSQTFPNQSTMNPLFQGMQPQQQQQAQPTQQTNQTSQSDNNPMAFLMNMARNGNPQQAQDYINNMIANGQMSQAQFEQYKQQAQTIGRMFGLL